MTNNPAVLSEARAQCNYCGGSGRFQIVSPVSDHAWTTCFCSRPAIPPASDAPASGAGEDTDEFETVEAWEHDDQRELSLLYNHKAHDRPQFNRGQMRLAIRHGRGLAAAAPKVASEAGAGLREVAERLLKAMTTRALRGRDHVPSMRDEQDAATALRKALATDATDGGNNG